MNPIGLIHICLYGCLCVHETAATLDGVAELPGTQTSQQTDVNECHWEMIETGTLPSKSIVFGWVSCDNNHETYRLVLSPTSAREVLVQHAGLVGDSLRFGQGGFHISIQC